MIAMLAGVLLGLWVHYNGTPAQIDAFSNYIGVLTDIFLRMIKMIIAPLVFSTLVVGIAKSACTSARLRNGNGAAVAITATPSRNG